MILSVWCPFQGVDAARLVAAAVLCLFIAAAFMISTAASNRKIRRQQREVDQWTEDWLKSKQR